MNIGIYIYDEAEVLDFSGPFEVFSTASRVSSPADTFKVFLVSETGDTVIARGGYSVNPHYSFLNHPPIDVLIIVGGVHTEEMGKAKVLDWILTEAGKAKLVASVCTGVFLLAEAGVLSSQKVTTHWEDIPDLRESYPDLHVLENKRWVDEGNITTSGGISAGIDMSLYLILRRKLISRHSGVQKLLRSRRSSKAMVIPLSRAATLSWVIFELPNYLLCKVGSQYTDLQTTLSKLAVERLERRFDALLQISILRLNVG